MKKLPSFLARKIKFISTYFEATRKYITVKVTNCKLEFLVYVLIELFEVPEKFK